MNVISSVVNRFFRVVLKGGGAIKSVISTAVPALRITAMVGTVSGADLTWVGDDSSNLWDINTSQMWNDGSGAAVFNDGDTVTLDDTGSDSPAINLTATVSPACVTNNSAKNYTIEGAGTLAGTMTLTKSGTGTLTLSTTNTFSGAVVVTAGTLDFAPPNSHTLNNTVTGVGTIRKSGANTMVIKASAENANRFSGAVVVDGGTLQFDTNLRYRGLNYATSYTVNSGATLYAYGQTEMNMAAPVTLNEGILKCSTYIPIGTLTMSGGTLEAVNGSASQYRAIALNGHVTVEGSTPSVMKQTGTSNKGIHLAVKSATTTKIFSVADVTGDTNADLTVSAILVNSSQYLYACGLTKTGDGTMVLSAGNGYTGTTTVNAGTLLVSGSLTSPTVNVNDGGTLLVSSGSPMPSATITIASNGTFGAAGTVATSVTNLTFAEGANVSWAYDGGAQTAGCVNVAGTLTLPSKATVNLTGSGALHSDQVLFTAETVEGATDLSGWTFNNVPEGSYASILLIDHQVILKTFRGTVIRIL